MPLTWIPERPPRWNDDKHRIIGGAPEGVFKDPGYGAGDVVAGEWWRGEDEGNIVGYGWMDINWGDAEILLAVAPDRQRAGVGTFILDRLENEARARELNYMLNVVRPSHPDGPGLTAWLEKRGFGPSQDGVMRRRIPGKS